MFYSIKGPQKYLEVRIFHDHKGTFSCFREVVSVSFPDKVTFMSISLIVFFVIALMFTISNATMKSFDIPVTFLSRCTKLQLKTSARNGKFQLVKYLGWDRLARKDLRKHIAQNSLLSPC